MERPLILLAEDDAALSNGLKLALSTQRYEIHQAFNRREAENRWRSGDYSLVVLDISLPDGSGLELCREMRSISSAPVLFLTANDMELDVVAGFEAGGDDYMTKPFSLAILRARVEALLRRTPGREESRALRYGAHGFLFDFGRLTFAKEGTELALSRTEQRLLRLLIAGKGRTMTRELLVEDVWGYDGSYLDDNALSVAVSRLRAKLEDDPARPRFIRTVYGIGYAWCEPAEETP